VFENELFRRGRFRHEGLHEQRVEGAVHLVPAVSREQANDLRRKNAQNSNPVELVYIARAQDGGITGMRKGKEEYRRTVGLN
jgi:hypothetical protein